MTPAEEKRLVDEMRANVLVDITLAREGLPELGIYALRRGIAVFSTNAKKYERTIRVYEIALVIMLEKRGGLGDIEKRSLEHYFTWAATHRPTDRLSALARAGQIVTYTGGAISALSARDLARAGEAFALPDGNVGEEAERVAWSFLEAAAQEKVRGWA